LTTHPSPAYDDGRTQLLLCLHGLLPISFRQASYNIPIAVWVTKEYPRHPPIAYVVPTNDMLVKAGKFVDVSGRCTVEYIQHWERKSEGCSLSSLLEALQDQFSREPPVYSKPRNNPPPNVQPAVLSRDYAERPPPPIPPAIPSTQSRSELPQDDRPALPPRPDFLSPTLTAAAISVPSGQPTTLPHVLNSSLASRPAPPLPQTHAPPAPLQHPPTSPVPPPVPPIPPSYQSPSSVLGSSPLHPNLWPTRTGVSPPVGNASWSSPLPPARSISIASNYIGQQPKPPADQPYYVQSPPPDVSYHPPAPNLLDGESTESQTPSNPQLSSAPPPPRPPNPELLRLHAQVHQKFTSELGLLSQAFAIDAERQRSHQTGLLAGQPAILDEMARLEAVRDVCRNVAGRMRITVEQAERNIAELKRKGDPEVDELVCSTSIVHNQLINLVAEDNAVEDTIYHLHRALNTGRIDLERFLRTTRVLAEEQFMKRALIEKIHAGMPIGQGGGSNWT
jgi:ESCRT-I complex subunit TSG101